MRTAIKKRTYVTAPAIIAVVACLGFFLAPGVTAADTSLNPSSELKTLLKHAEKAFLEPMGLDLNLAINQAPDFLATATGLAMQRQMKYLNQHPEYMDRFNVLKDQALAFLNQVAKAHNYRNPEDGTRLSEAQMGLEFYAGLNGEPNDYFIETFNIDPARVKLPMMLAQVPEPDDDEPLGALYSKSDGLVLLGQRAEEVTPSVSSPGPKAGDRTTTTHTPGTRYGAPFVTELVCPTKVQPGTRHTVDTNNNPKDGIEVWCSYYGDGRLSKQHPVIQHGKLDRPTHGIEYVFKIKEGVYYLASKTSFANDERHGLRESYLLSKSGKPYLEYRDMWENGEEHGIGEVYVMSKTGEHFLNLRNTYTNGEKHGTEERFVLSDSGRPYLHSRQEYSHGVTRSSIEFYQTGKTHWRRFYDDQGKEVRNERYDDNGKLEMVVCPTDDDLWADCR